MKRTLLSILFTAAASSMIAQDCSDLFISEYVEGSGNNKAIELYNPTDATINLSQYQVGRFRDGSGTPMLLGLSGSLAPYDAYVIALDKRDPNGTGNEAPIEAALEAVADTFVNPVYVQANSPFYFNGDDAFGLFKGDGTQLVDVFGKIGEDPGVAWSDANGTWWTNEHTLIRKSTVLKGVTINPSEFEVELEWDSLPQNTFTELGAHTCDCQALDVTDKALANFNIYPNPSTDKNLIISASGNLSAIQVYDILGKESAVVRFSNTRTNYKRMNLDNLPSGIYVIRVTLDDDTVLSRKVMLGK